MPQTDIVVVTINEGPSDCGPHPNNNLSSSSPTTALNEGPGGLSGPSTSDSPSMLAVLRHISKLSFSLEGLCNLIEGEVYMQRAEIIRALTYVDTKLIAPHRFLLLELWMPDEATMWLRLERMPTGRGDLASGKGKTPSNDQVSTSIAGVRSRA